MRLDVKSYLDTFVNLENQLDNVHPFDLKLARMKKFLNLLGDPQKDLKIIHVAGSKGKGSTCAFISNILSKAGYKVGLYTSPHIYSYRERIRVSGKVNVVDDDLFNDSISEKELSDLVFMVKDVVESFRYTEEFGRLTFYELFTGLAFLYFKQQFTDYCVIETGLGGRLDATNAADSKIAVITPISLEHTHILGDTVGQIAMEKAAIIKAERQKVIIAPQEREAMEVIVNRCFEFNIHPRAIHPQEICQFEVGLKGAHQRINAMTALAAVHSLDDAFISEDAKREGLLNIFWPGRFEMLSTDPLIVVDCAHNVSSCHELVQTFKETFHHKKATLILGVSTDKNLEGMAEELSLVVDKIIFTRANHPRARSLEINEVENFFPGKEVYKTNTVQDAIQIAEHLNSDNPILVAGSVFAVSEARGCISTRV